MNSLLKIFVPIILVAAFFLLGSSCNAQSNTNRKWVATWSTAPQLVETANMPPSPGLTNNSLRQILRVSIGGDTIRVRFSNTFSNNAVNIKSVQIAASTGASTTNSSTSKELTFNGSAHVTMNAGNIIASDPIAFKLTPRMDVAITINYGQTSASVTGHPGSRTTSYLQQGTSSPTTSFINAVKTEHWYTIFGIDVKANSDAASVAILGNSITDGRGSTTNQQNRWLDILSERLLANIGTKEVGILNLGIGGNCLLKSCLGASGVSRFQRDILDQPGIRVAIIAEAVNDIGGVKSSTDATAIYNALVTAYSKMITDAQAKDIKVYGATVMPFKGSFHHNQFSEQCRNNINKWIRTSNKFDAVIDFDKAMGSLEDPAKLATSYQNDNLHPDAAGYLKMGNSIDLNLFKALGTHMVTGFDNALNEQEIGAYPNPFTSDGLNITMNDIFTYQITGLAGIIVEEGRGQDNILIGKDLLPGIYILSVTNAQGVSTKRIINKLI